MIKKKYLLLILLALIFLSWWLLFKPYFDRKICHKEALDYSLTQGLLGAKGTKEGIEAAIQRKQLYDPAYEYCLHDRGIGF